MYKISLCVPLYNESENINEFYNQTKELFEQELSHYDWELLFVNDGSTDNSLEIIHKLHEINKKVKVIDLSRNYGKELAMLSGLEHITGDCVVILDSDLQHPISKIPEMVSLWEIGYQDVYGKRLSRKSESFFKVKISQCYYKLLSYLSDTPIENGIGDFRLLDKEVVTALISIKDKQRYTKGLYNFVGFKKIDITYDAQSRFAGETKWNLKQLIKLGIEGITDNSVKPLQISTVLGFVISFLSFFYLIYTVVRGFFGLTEVDGYSSLMGVILLLGGIQLISIGILGTYLGKTYSETKDRPLYFKNEKTTKLDD